jgi:4-hydroxy-tetrahydrodipicolinate reductase
MNGPTKVTTGAPVARLGLLGGSGRTGQLVRQVLESEFAGRAELVAAPERGQSFAPLRDCDVVIDFAVPEATGALVAEWLAAPAGSMLPALVVGSTGWKLEDSRRLEELARRTPVLMSANFSTGVQALLAVLRAHAPLLDKLGYSPVIVETHHRHKKDAPSGTALSLQRAISPVGPGKVQTHAVRAGEVVGDHEVTFYGPGDHLTFGHIAQDRSIFARGAIEAALWLAERRAQTAPTPVAGTSPVLGMEQFFHERFA